MPGLGGAWPRAAARLASGRDRDLDDAVDDAHRVVAEATNASEAARLGLDAGRVLLRLAAGRASRPARRCRRGGGRRSSASGPGRPSRGRSGRSGAGRRPRSRRARRSRAGPTCGDTGRPRRRSPGRCARAGRRGRRRRRGASHPPAGPRGAARPGRARRPPRREQRRRERQERGHAADGSAGRGTARPPGAPGRTGFEGRSVDRRLARAAGHAIGDRPGGRAPPAGPRRPRRPRSRVGRRLVGVRSGISLIATAATSATTDPKHAEPERLGDREAEGPVDALDDLGIAGPITAWNCGGTAARIAAPRSPTPVSGLRSKPPLAVAWPKPAMIGWGTPARPSAARAGP